MHRIRAAALLLVALLAVAAPLRAQVAVAEAPPVPELAGLDAYIDEAMRDWAIPGLAIAIIRNDSVIFAGGYGERALGSGEPVDEHTLFAIASTTKAFTVGLLGTLVDADRLDWDDPVRAHLPGFELEDPYVTRSITVRDLLTHRTGVSRSDNVWIAAPLDRAEILRRARFLSQADGFREGYGYNNIMYMAAGEVAAAAAGVPWEELLETRLFGPLGMTRSTPRSAVVAARENVAASHVWSGGRVVPVPHRNYDALGPAGSVFSSAWEMAQWVRLHLNDGTYDGRRILDSATVAEMHAPQVIMRLDSVDHRLFPTTHFSAYGLGWRMQDYHGRKIVQHTGAVNWMRTQVGMIPEEGIGVVVLTNLTSSRLQTALMYRVFDALLGIPATDWSAEHLALAARSNARSEESAAERNRSRARNTRPSLPLADYAGTYADSLYGEVEVALEDGSLVLRYSPDYVADLEHWHHDTFRAAWRRAGFGHSFVTFPLDTRGRARTLDLDGFGAFDRVTARAAAASR